MLPMQWKQWHRATTHRYHWHQSLCLNWSIPTAYTNDRLPQDSHTGHRSYGMRCMAQSQYTSTSYGTGFGVSWPSPLPHMCARMLLQLWLVVWQGQVRCNALCIVVYVCHIYAVRVRADRVCSGWRCGHGVALSRQLGRVVKAID